MTCNDFLAATARYNAACTCNACAVNAAVIWAYALANKSQTAACLFNWTRADNLPTCARA